MAKKVRIYTDGGARGNPGPAGIGGFSKGEKKSSPISKTILVPYLDVMLSNALWISCLLNDLL